MNSPSGHVVVIGGGITGLSAAYAVIEEAQKANSSVRCTILEQDSRWGGKILTHTIHNLLIEGGPDSFLTTKPAALELCRALGLEHRLLQTNAHHNRTFAFCRGKLRELPQGLLAFRPQRVDSLVTSGLLSLAGMLRMGAERFWPRPSSIPHDESLSAFFSRRFGREAFTNLLEPLVAGIYAGDAEELSIEATFPRFREFERTHGSVIKGMRAMQGKSAGGLRASEKPLSMFMSLRGGLGELIQVLVLHLKSREVQLRSGIAVRELEAPSGPTSSYRLVCDNGQILSADAVVVTTPAYNSSELLRQISPELATALGEIPYASTATVSFAYKTDSMQSSIRGFGFVVPRNERRALLAATWSSLKWPDRTGSEDTLVRTYVGGRGREAIFEKDDQDVVKVIREELTEMAGITAAPHYVEVHRWMQGMPQYVLGHQKRLSIIEQLLKGWPRLFLAGAAFRGIGIPDCIRDGMRVGQEAFHKIVQARNFKDRK
ncbi:MAG: protoporphyrinogen oxidase [Nitrospirales bacterium]